MVSIIIPTYNRSELLRQCLSSIIAQTYQNFEVLVLDDGSNDDTFGTVKSFNDKRMKYINNGKFSDVAKLRNIGIQVSKGNFIAFCDDDDIWQMNKLSVQVEYLNKYKFICSNANLIDKKSDIISERFISFFDQNCIITTEMLLITNLILTSSVVIERNLINNSTFLESGINCSAEDYELWLRLSVKENIFFINRELISFRSHSNTSSFQSNAALINNVIRIISTYEKTESKDIRRASNKGKLLKRIQLIKIYFIERKIKKMLMEIVTVIFGFKNSYLLLYVFEKYILKKPLISKRKAIL